jgi:hypothetical protein
MFQKLAKFNSILLKLYFLKSKFSEMTTTTRSFEIAAVSIDSSILLCVEREIDL